MKRISFLLLLFVILLIPGYMQSYDWSNFAATDLETYNFTCVGGGICYEIICEENGMMILEEEWQEYSYGFLPIWDVEMIISATADLLVVMGNGSYSDGIYSFNFSNHEFNVIEWMINPRFLEYSAAETCFYAGGESGLWKSEDGFTWSEVIYFSSQYCFDMSIHEGHYVVSTENNVHYSTDAGENWEESNTMQNLTDLTVSQDGIFYGVFPGSSWSSGLYSSEDSGQNWQVEVYTPNMSCLGFDMTGKLFTGWEEPQTGYQGVGYWQQDIQEFQFFNEGLGCLNINHLCYHPLIDCYNVVACTDQGLYMLTDYSVSNTPGLSSPPQLSACIYPNPFNPSTMINCHLAEDTFLKVDIFNIKGELVRNLYQGYTSAGNQIILWNGKDNRNKLLPSGYYSYLIKSPREKLSGKMLLIK